VDESQQVVQERRARRATIQDVGEESDESGSHDGDSPDDDAEADDSQDEIVQEIERWKAEVRARRLQALENVPVVEMDSWLQYTGWNAVLHQSKHDMIKTFHYTRDPDSDDRENESKLDRVVRAWKRILERCLDTLAAADQKDVLKWWKSPKNEAADQHPFELPQNTKSMEKYSTVWEGMICYFMRTAPSEHWEDETGRRFSHSHSHSHSHAHSHSHSHNPNPSTQSAPTASAAGQKSGQGRGGWRMVIMITRTRAHGTGHR